MPVAVPDTPPATGPLAGLRILDLTTVLLGPYATRMLGDLGAEVIRVEPPGGEGRRNYGPARHPDMAAQYLNVNRAKRCIVLDLKQAAGREALLRIASGCDALVHNSRPAAMKRLGLDYEAVAAVRPDIVYCAAVGFGQSGRYASRPAYDDIIQGLSALPALLGRVAGRPQFVPINLADRIAAYATANAVLAALLCRARGGRGQYVEVPMFETVAEFVLSEHLWARNFEPPLEPAGEIRLFHRRPYATRDGWICIMVASDEQWRRFCGVVGRPGLADDPRYARRAERNRHLDEVYAITESCMPARTTAEWLDLLAQADVPAGPLHTVDSLVDDPHLADVGFFRIEPHPTEGSLRAVTVPSRWSETPPGEPRHAPVLGEHSEEILREAGYADDAIEALLASGVTAGPRRTGSRP